MDRLSGALALPVLIFWLSSAAPIAAAAPQAGALAVWRAGAWHTWWRADHAPSRWERADSSLVAALRWRRLSDGLDWATVRLACGAPTWRTRLIVARLDPRRLDLSLVMDMTRAEHRPAWSIDRSPADAVLAVNAGQFVSTMPWGWVVIEGAERLRPGQGPLASAIVIDVRGGVRWAHSGTPPTAGMLSAFQSYPTLLAGEGRVPPPLLAGRDVSLTHRDTRLALGQTRDGMLLVVLTRFDAVGDWAAGLPLGPTTPEMAAIMGALGATDAVMLDGGISAQLLLRAPGGKALRWPGIRKVPLGLVARVSNRLATPPARPPAERP